jgi:flavin-dependent dehydrogenase
VSDTRGREVVVAGGGPAGAATAIFLRQRGHDVVLLDAARFPRDKVCGESVSPEAWRLLEELGAAPAVRALEPFPIRGMTLTSPDGTAFRGDYRRAPAPGFAIRRVRFDAALLATARTAGVEVREGTRVTGLLRGTAGEAIGVRCENGRGPEELRARLVVAAEGRRSVIARSLGLLREHPTLRRFAVRGYWEGIQGLEERGEMHVAGGGYCGIAPLSPTLANVAFVLTAAALRRAGGDIEAFYRQELRDRWPRIAERLHLARLLGAPRAIGPLAIEARAVSAPGALLVGDAAGFYDPFTGEGVTLALRGAELAAGVADRALEALGTPELSAYDRSRHAATCDKFRVNRLMHTIVGWPSLGNAVARRLARRPDLADRLVGIAGDFIPAKTALDLGFVWQLLWA